VISARYPGILSESRVTVEPHTTLYGLSAGQGGPAGRDHLGHLGVGGW